MRREFSGKKILILGATTETIPLVNAANQLGVVTYVADHIEDSPAKRFARVPVLADCLNVDLLCGIVNDEDIDGVMVGCADILVRSYQQVCERTGKHCYATGNQVEVFTDKKRLKAKLRDFGLPTVPEYQLDERLLKSDLEGIEYPVLIKPVDSNSARGISVCYDEDELRGAFHKAKENSRSNTVLIEKFMDCDDFTVNYIFQDGEVVVTMMSDRYVNSEQKGVGTLPSALIYPSKHSELYYTTTHEQMLDLFRDCGIKNGVMSLQAFIENDRIMFYDPAFRITGGQGYYILKSVNSVDQLEMLVRFALSGSMSDENLSHTIDGSLKNKCAMVLSVLVKPGFIGNIDGIDEANDHPNVINVTQQRREGDVITEYGTLSQVAARIHLVAGSMIEILDAAEYLQSRIRVTDLEGNDMLLKSFNKKDL
ncbi:MAG: ATP-grasp domain-containing protein [Fastidiosipila sp.]|nr:ATP-grasp domain-containing protein [Fastidiosipila sp.]